ncbi:MAG: hypothetical protein Q4F05_15690 [bacterium]|nr:hypothetical protein [bacterium]
MKYERVLLTAIFIELTGFFICYFFTMNTGDITFIIGSLIVALGAFIGILGIVFKTD